ncbi:hypothetical protein BC831DRAFT_453174 [Entophlyctis helioformis]|nr:hypothetical protein BC831DRAFT_453174 [Entophlyctis helioformis]
MASKPNTKGKPPSKPPIKTTLTKEKLEVFSVGIQKKSAFQKAKEAEEAKRKREEEDAARVYEEFAASFDDAPPSINRSWVKSSTVLPGSVSAGSSSSNSNSTPSSSLYKPTSRIAPSGSANPSRLGSQSLAAATASASSTAPTAPPATAGQKRRNMDAFLEEVKRENADQGTHKHARSHESQPLLSDVSCNVYVGNMAMETTEQDLLDVFAPFGPIASVKVMVPRTMEEVQRNRKWCFVCFMERAHAVRALRCLAGRSINGQVMNLDWGKVLAIPAEAYYVMPEDERRWRLAAMGITDSKDSSSRSRTLSRPGPDVPKETGLPDVRVSIPTNPLLLGTIHRTIERVLVHGPQFEALLMAREQNNQEYLFLFDSKSKEHIYYRWRLYSLLQGDTRDKWRHLPFLMVEGGPRWIPPEMPFEEEPTVNDEDGGSGSDSSRSDSDFSEPEMTVYPKVTTDKVQIAEIMVFCILHADAAEEVASMIVQSLLVADTPIFPTKFGRLFVVSDLLHNSAASVPNAWKYRDIFQRRLPEVLTHLGVVWKTIGSRLKAEQVRKAIMSLLAVWESGMIFTPGYTDQLRAAFVEGTKDGAGDGHGNQGQSDNKGDDGGLDGEALVLTAEQIMAAKFKSSFAPVPLAGSEDPAPASDARDTTATAAPAKVEAGNATKDAKDGDDDDDEDLDGVPLTTLASQTNANEADDDDEDLDGVPLQRPPAFDPPTQAPVGISGDGGSSSSSMDAVDDGDEDLDGVPMTTSRGLAGVPKIVFKAATVRINPFTAKAKAAATGRMQSNQLQDDDDDDDDMFG